MLVLLIIFMVTAPLLTQGIKVDLPKAGAEPLPEELMRDHQPLILSVDASGPAGGPAPAKQTPPKPRG